MELPMEGFKTMENDSARSDYADVNFEEWLAKVASFPKDPKFQDESTLNALREAYRAGFVVGDHYGYNHGP